ncbi:PREDICTED: nucleoside diphosphate-linked moiety X motif 19, mitochondrial [Dinoponera quadriceps]|uniref:Nucleoside diphosphate-linked moiety X motif 19, mitochondrial n=1 Tax=Dinoponera quadriceps TaxID=609295 RepID=A0A6P3YEG0_DINQU|nr:PREDICTED: nucleoside diphosphate-linked moiety X motif 19, mitochondrial [Dinoponera quadriceps]XP_014489511.1 PREDICTED: nucleoside diphosphate-linked moiety X motif 19, mitochondrial [Dinoponera quadriceps]
MAAWRYAASLILIARHGQKYRSPVSSSVQNYNMLCLKRHQKSSFMPGSYVFPGGNIDPVDSDLKWYELFASFGFDNDSFTSLTPKTTVRPQIFKAQQNELLRDISLRITAIRETFEECGVLICKQRGEEPSVEAQYLSVPKEELQTWQKKIHNNASEFLTFCKKFDCYPDLWALHEWNNWLTPTYLEKRYNTVFYLACVQSTPDTEYDVTEIEDLIWETPENIWSTTDIILPPPQQYEITKFATFRDIDHILDYAVQRGKVGVQCYLPVRVNLKDGFVHVLPGDTMYPKKIDPNCRLIIDKSNISMDEFREMTPLKNRIEFLDVRMTILHIDDVQITDGRISPKPGEPQIKHKY